MTCKKTNPFQLLNSTNGYWQQFYWVSLCFYFKLCPSPIQYYVRDVATFKKKAKGHWRQHPDMEAYQKQPQNQGVGGKVQIQ